MTKVYIVIKQDYETCSNIFCEVFSREHWQKIGSMDKEFLKIIALKHT